MGTLVFVCPTTGHEVSTGVEVDRSSFKSLPRTKTAMLHLWLPMCMIGSHRQRLAAKDAALDDMARSSARRR